MSSQGRGVHVMFPELLDGWARSIRFGVVTWLFGIVVTALSVGCRTRSSNPAADWFTAHHSDLDAVHEMLVADHGLVTELQLDPIILGHGDLRSAAGGRGQCGSEGHGAAFPWPCSSGRDASNITEVEALLGIPKGRLDDYARQLAAAEILQVSSLGEPCAPGGTFVFLHEQHAMGRDSPAVCGIPSVLWAPSLPAPNATCTRLDASRLVSSRSGAVGTQSHARNDADGRTLASSGDGLVRARGEVRFTRASMEPIPAHLRPLLSKGTLRPLIVAVLGNVLAVGAQLPEILGRPAVNGFMHVPVFGGLAALGLAVATPIAVIVVSLPLAGCGERGVESGARVIRWTVRVIAVLLSLAVMLSKLLTLDVMGGVLHVRFFVR